MESTFNQAAKALFTNKQEAIKAALNNVVNAKGIATSAAQLVAITSYQAFETNGATIPAAQIGALLNLSDDENKKLKQYVSRANFVWGYKGRTYSVDNVDTTTPHTELMTEQAPSITTIYKEIFVNRCDRRGLFCHKLCVRRCSINVIHALSLIHI